MILLDRFGVDRHSASGGRPLSTLELATGTPRTARVPSRRPPAVRPPHGAPPSTPHRAEPSAPQPQLPPPPPLMPALRHRTRAASSARRTSQCAAEPRQCLTARHRDDRCRGPCASSPPEPPFPQPFHHVQIASFELRRAELTKRARCVARQRAVRIRARRQNSRRNVRSYAQRRQRRIKS